MIGEIKRVNLTTSSIIEHVIKPISLVDSCSECSKEKIDGKINVKGAIHRELMRDSFGNLNCRKCPVHLNSVQTGEFYEILKQLDGEK